MLRLVTLFLSGPLLVSYNRCETDSRNAFPFGQMSDKYKGSSANKLNRTRELSFCTQMGGHRQFLRRHRCPVGAGFLSAKTKLTL
jgi:hypothetical protein